MVKKESGFNDNNQYDTEHFRKVFIGGLDHRTTEESLKAFYEQWGTIIDVVVMKDPKTKRSRGFGFVTYTDQAMVDAAQAARPHRIDGKVVEAKRAVPRSANNPEANVTVKKIFVAGIYEDVPDDELRDYFAPYGNILNITMVKDKDTGKKRGFGFVEFDDYDAVDKICQQSSHTLRGKRIDVKKALGKQELARYKKPEDKNGDGNSYGSSGPGYSSGGSSYGGGGPGYSSGGPGYGGGGPGYVAGPPGYSGGPPGGPPAGQGYGPPANNWGQWGPPPADNAGYAAPPMGYGNYGSYGSSQPYGGGNTQYPGYGMAPPNSGARPPVGGAPPAGGPPGVEPYGGGGADPYHSSGWGNAPPPATGYGGGDSFGGGYQQGYSAGPMRPAPTQTARSAPYPAAAKQEPNMGYGSAYPPQNQRRY